MSDDNTEGVVITVPVHAYAIVKLHGAFFDNYRNFPAHEFWSFIQSKQGNALKVDISFEDTDQILDFEEIKRMSLFENYQSYITGSCITDRKRKKGNIEIPDSTNRGGVPDVHINHPLIHYGDVDSTVCGKCYVIPATGNIKFEISVCESACNNDPPIA